MNKMHLLFFLMIFLLLAGACTEVDLYDDPNYTQRTEVKFSYDKAELTFQAEAEEELYEVRIWVEEREL